MKTIRFVIDVLLPEDYNEAMVKNNIANAIINANGDILEIEKLINVEDEN